MLSATLIWPGLAGAQEIIRTEYGNVFVIPLKDYLDRAKRPACHKLPRIIGYKAFQSQDQQNFTPEEYRLLAGDSPYLGLRGHDYWYDRDKRQHVPWDDLFKRYGPFQSGNWDDLPVLCGAKDQPKPKVVKTTPAKNPATRYSGFNDYILHRAPGLVTQSYYDSPGDQWCRHVYVSVIAEYENDQAKKSLLFSGPATYLEDNIIPEIKKICPEFPNAAKYYRQTIAFKFRPKVVAIADERINPDKLNFTMEDDGSPRLIRDIAYKNWMKYNTNTVGKELVIEFVQLENERLFSQESGLLELYITSSNTGLGLAKLERDIKGNSPRTRNLIRHYTHALDQFKKAKKALDKAAALNAPLTLSATGQIDELVSVYFRHKTLADKSLQAALDIPPPKLAIPEASP